MRGYGLVPDWRNDGVGIDSSVDKDVVYGLLKERGDRDAAEEVVAGGKGCGGAAASVGVSTVPHHQPYLSSQPIVLEDLTDLPSQHPISPWAIFPAPTPPLSIILATRNEFAGSVEGWVAAGVRRGSGSGEEAGLAREGAGEGGAGKDSVVRVTGGVEGRIEVCWGEREGKVAADLVVSEGGGAADEGRRRSVAGR